MNMAPDEDYGLRQETVYDYATPEVQQAQVDYVGVRLAQLNKHGKLGFASTFIKEVWPQHVQKHHLVALHQSDKLSKLKDFWENYYSLEELEWVKQPNLFYPGSIAWLMPTPNPAILLRHTVNAGVVEHCVNYQRCMQFINNYEYWIDNGEINPDLVTFPNVKY